jgi:hypothetical protein
LSAVPFWNCGFKAVPQRIKLNISILEKLVAKAAVPPEA